MTQEMKIFNYLKEHKTLTNREAMLKLGIGRLPSRVCDMKKSGVNIKKEMRKVMNADGSESCVAFYYLGDEHEDRA